MQHVATLETVSPAARKAAALSAYDAALCDPAGADWQTVAHLLHAALPAGRTSVLKSEQTPEAGAPRWWADWKLGKVYSLDTLSVLFSDGVSVRCNIAQAPRKLPRIAAACRVAIAFYRAKTGRDVVPAFAHVENVSDGSTFDAKACSRLTADLRRTAVPATVARPVTAERVATMRAELQRRRDGLALAEADRAALNEAQAEVRNMHGPMQVAARREAEARVAMWRAAVDGAEIDLREMSGTDEPESTVIACDFRPAQAARAPTAPECRPSPCRVLLARLSASVALHSRTVA